MTYLQESLVHCWLPFRAFIKVVVIVKHFEVFSLWHYSVRIWLSVMVMVHLLKSNHLLQTLAIRLPAWVSFEVAFLNDKNLNWRDEIIDDWCVMFNQNLSQFKWAREQTKGRTAGKAKMYDCSRIRTCAGKPNGFRVHPLNHSGTQSMTQT